MTEITRHWFTGLLRAVITGASTAMSVTLSQAIVTGHIDWKVVGGSVLITSGLRLAEYLKRHPLPGVKGEGETVEMRAVDIPDDFRDTTEIPAAKDPSEAVTVSQRRTQ